jgi:hypothetical protein
MLQELLAVSQIGQGCQVDEEYHPRHMSDSALHPDRETQLGASPHRLPLGFGDLDFWMRDEQVPDHSLESF